MQGCQDCCWKYCASVWQDNSSPNQQFMNTSGCIFSPPQRPSCRRWSCRRVCTNGCAKSRTLDMAFPRNSACPICKRSRMYKKKVDRFRHDPVADGGAIEPTTVLGERLATDFIIVKSSHLAEKTLHRLFVMNTMVAYEPIPLPRAFQVLSEGNCWSFSPGHTISRAEWWNQTKPDKLAQCCLNFLGFFESALENRHPHNSVLERDIRSLEGVSKSLPSAGRVLHDRRALAT